MSHPDSYDAREHQKYMLGVSCHSTTSPDSSVETGSSSVGTPPRPAPPTHLSPVHTHHKPSRRKKHHPTFKVGSPLSDSVIPEVPEKPPTPGTPKKDIREMFPSLDQPETSIYSASSNTVSSNLEDVPAVTSNNARETGQDLSDNRPTAENTAQIGPQPCLSGALVRSSAPCHISLSHSSTDPHPLQSGSPSQSQGRAEGGARMPRASSLPHFSPKCKSSPLEPEMSTVTAMGTKVEVAIEALSNDNSG